MIIAQLTFESIWRILTLPSFKLREKSNFGTKKDLLNWRRIRDSRVKIE